MTSLVTTVPVARGDLRDRSLYRAIWRWHFYAGLLVLPFMVLLAVTGALYLFKDDLNATVFAYRTIAPSDPATPSMAASDLLARAAAARPGARPTAIRLPADPTASTLVTLDDAGVPWWVWLDPRDGRVLDAVPKADEFNQAVRKLHSLEYFGMVPSRLIEAVGGFALVLVASGVYLWWPRGQGGALRVRSRPAARVFWRDLHAVTGILAAALILFLAATGMFWTGFWGNQLNRQAAAIGQGYPAAMWDDVPVSTVPTSRVVNQPGWAVENAPVPLSAPPAGGVGPIGVDGAIAIATARGIAPGFEVALPYGPKGVYSASVFPMDAPSRERMIHIDQYSGKVLVDVGFADYGAVAKTIEYGTNIHMGQLWGRLNQAVMLVAALAVLLSSVSAGVMWWKRRPHGRLGVPPYPQRPGVYRWLWAMAVGFGVLFPLSGLGIVAMLAIDLLLIRTVPPLRRAFA